MRFPLLSIALLLPAFALAQGPKPKFFSDVAEITAKFDPPSAKPGEAVKLLVTVKTKLDFHTYALVQPKGQTPKCKLVPPKSDAITFDAVIPDPAGWADKPGTEPGEIDRYYPDETVTWTITGKVKSVTAGKKSFDWTGSRIQACNDACFNSKLESFPVLEFEVLPGGTPPSTTPATTPATPSETATTPPETPVPKSSDPFKLLNFLGQAAFWGLVSLITPCVFPMIPITVSLFLKQGNHSPRKTLTLAAIYCITITLVLGLAATFVLSLFTKLSVNPVTNVLLALMMIFFALSLFGMYDITLPNFLLKGAEAKRKQGGTIGTIFAAIAFSIVSFTCVAPFLGGFAGLAASGAYSTLELMLGGLTFGAAFAAPFFLLALFPSLLKKLPRSGGWLDTVKAVMGFLEVAAALKFARTAEVIWLDPPKYFTYDVCLAGFIILSFACGAYLLKLFRLPHDDDEAKKIPVPQLVFALTFLGFGVYLIPGLFKGPDGMSQRPKGEVFAWVDSFLLPDAEASVDPKVSGEVTGDKSWGRDLEAETKRIAAEVKAWEDGGKKGDAPPKRFLFLDFTGKTCPNCKLNERNVFPIPEIQDLLGRFTKVQLYTDAVPEALYAGKAPSLDEREAEALRNGDLQVKRFGTSQLPTYIILEPLSDGTTRVVGTYGEGKINDVKAFAEFLRKPLGK